MISVDKAKGQVVVRDPSVKGVHRTNGGETSQESSVFVLKGQGSVTVFPKNPTTNK